MTQPLPETSVADARAIVLGEARVLSAEDAKLLDAADRVLAEDLVAPRDLPPWDNSQMDGYAVRAADLRHGAVLAVTETVFAGRVATKRVGAGEAIRIMTGAPMPEGADTVVPVEGTDGGRDRVTLTGAVPAKGEWVRRAGEDLKRGDVALARGTVLGPAAIGVAASLGRDRVRVHRRPVVAILATGDELAEPGEDAGERRIYASSSWALAAAIRGAGGDARYAGIARDTREELLAKIQAALDGSDVLLTTGGVSVGEADHVRGVLGDLRAHMKFWRVAQRPGYPLAFGRIGDALVFGLPGNPVSTMVSFEEYVQPALLKMAGRTRLFPAVVEARLEENVKGGRGRFQFLRGVLRRDGAGFVVKTTGNQSSGVFTSLARGNSLILVPADVKELAAGAVVHVQVTDPDFFAMESAGF